MSNSNIEMTQPDIYGQCHPIETPTLIETKLKEFEEELLKLPEEKTISLKMANEKCPPGYIDNDFKLMFLRCEVFNVDVSIQYSLLPLLLCMNVCVCVPKLVCF